MPRTITFLLLFLSAGLWGPLQAQSFNCTIQGHLFRASTGSPLPNHMVEIIFDSTGQFSYHDSVQTDAFGYYQKTVSVPANYTGPAIHLRAPDCGATWTRQYAYQQGLTQYTGTDNICGTNLSMACSGGFTWAQVNGNTYRFTDSVQTGDPAIGVVSWYWEFGDGSTSTSDDPSHAYTTPGLYEVCMEAITAAGCPVTICDSVLINPTNVNCDAAWYVTGPNVATFQFTHASSAVAGIATHYWEFGDGNSSSAPNPTHVYAQPGVYQVRHAIVANDSCYHRVEMPVTYNPVVCAASFSVDRYYDPFSIAVYSVSALPNGSQATSMVWDFGDGSTVSQVGWAAHRYASPGSYQICLTMTTTTGCVSSACDTLVIGNGACVAGFGYWPLGGNVVMFQDSSYAAAGIATYLWHFGDGDVSFSPNPAHIYPGPGLYQASLTIVGHDSCRNTIYRQVDLLTSSSCYAYYTSMLDSSGQYTVLIHNQSAGYGLQYLWDFGDGGTSTLAYPTHVYQAAGTYDVCLYVGNGLNCHDSYCSAVWVPYRLSQPFSINVIDPNAVAITPPATSALGLSLHPNPASDAVTLSLQLLQAAKGHVRVIDARGQVVREQALGQLAAGANEAALDVQALPDGIYLVEVVAGGQRSVVRMVCAR